MPQEIRYLPHNSGNIKKEYFFKEVRIMALKSKKYAMYEAIQYEMRKDPLLTFFYEYQRPTASGPGGKIIDIFTEFGYPRVWDCVPLMKRG
jgi:hypothetical protein